VQVLEIAKKDLQEEHFAEMQAMKLNMGEKSKCL
jgi:hypothetical protein